MRSVLMSPCDSNDRTKSGNTKASADSAGDFSFENIPLLREEGLGEVDGLAMNFLLSVNPLSAKTEPVSAG